jgi:hypothetical protein
MSEQQREFLNNHYRELERAERRAEQWRHNFGVETVGTVEETSETSETKVLTSDKNQVG